MKPAHRPQNYGQLSVALIGHVSNAIRRMPIIQEHLGKLHPQAIGSGLGISWCDLSDDLCATVKLFVERNGESQVERVLRQAREKKGIVAGFCSVCGGWTMMHGDPSGDTAKEWIRIAYACGDLIMAMSTPTSLGMACPQVDLPLADRTCDA